MVNHKTLYKIVLVFGLLLTMVFTLSLTKYTIAYAEDVQPPTAETGNTTENDRLDFDACLLEQAREIIGNDINLSDEQLSKLHQIGFNDQQIKLLIEIIQDDTSIKLDNQPYSSVPIFLYISLIFMLLLFVMLSILFKRRKPSIS